MVSLGPLKLASAILKPQLSIGALYITETSHSKADRDRIWLESPKVSRKLAARPFLWTTVWEPTRLQARKHKSWRGETGKTRLMPVIKERVRKRKENGPKELAQRVYS